MTETEELRNALDQLTGKSEEFWQRIVDSYGDDPNWTAFPLARSIGNAKRTLAGEPPERGFFHTPGAKIPE